jgi:hypothetical protein
MNADAVEAAFEVGHILVSLGVPYLVGGSMACIVWGEPRFTQDVDFVAALEAQHVDGLLDALGGDWYADRSSIEDAIKRRSSFNIIRLSGMIKVDVFVPPEDGLHASKWSRAQAACLRPGESRELMITSPEDILLQKLDWYRQGGEVSEQQWRDVLSLLRLRVGRLDDPYLDRWASEMGLEDLMERARQEATA